MRRITILCVEDESEVRDALVRDLDDFATQFRIEAAEDADDAHRAIEACIDAGDPVGLVLCDHVLPGQCGADLLVDLKDDPATASARKVLVTGQAGLNDTIKAINDADLDHYVAKPWTREILHDVVRKHMTDYVIDEEEDLLPFVSILDGPRLLEAHRQRNQCE